MTTFKEYIQKVTSEDMENFATSPAVADSSEIDSLSENKPSLDWSRYDQKVAHTENTKRDIDDATKIELENIAMKAVGANHLRGSNWGEVLGYGNDAIAVILVHPPHKYEEYGPVIAKILDKNPEHYRSFHDKFKVVREVLDTLRSGVRYQKTIDQKYVDSWLSTAKEGVPVQILSYVHGSDLENVESVSTDVLDHFFLDIIIPTWDKGIRFFDFRKANLVYSKKGGLNLIDLDMLSKGFHEIETEEWDKRNVLEKTAFSRMPGIVKHMLKLAGYNITGTAIKEAFSNSGFIKSLQSLGRGGSAEDAANKYRKFVVMIEDYMVPM